MSEEKAKEYEHKLQETLGDFSFVFGIVKDHAGKKIRVEPTTESHCDQKTGKIILEGKVVITIEDSHST